MAFIVVLAVRVITWLNQNVENENKMWISSDESLVCVGSWVGLRLIEWGDATCNGGSGSGATGCLFPDSSPTPDGEGSRSPDTPSTPMPLSLWLHIGFQTCVSLEKTVIRWQFPCADATAGLSLEEQREYVPYKKPGQYIYISPCHSLSSSQLTLPPPCILKSILYVCISIPVLPLGSSEPFFFFRVHIYVIKVYIF